VTGRAQAFASRHVLGAGNSILQVTAYSVIDGNYGGNYAVHTYTASGTITKATLDISAVTDSKTYDGTTSSSATPTVSGLRGSDDVTGKTQAFQSRNVLGAGASILVVTGYTVADGNAGGNYDVHTHTASGTISAKNLTINGALANNKIYDGNMNASVDFTVASLGGTISGDSVSIDSSGYLASFPNKNVGTAKAVTVTGVALSGGDAGNYTVSQPSGLTANITARTLTVNGLSASNKVYNGTAAAALTGTPALVGVVSGDAVSLTGTPAGAFDNKNVGNGKPVGVSGLSLTGTGASNYSLTQPTLAANITQRTLNVTATGVNKVFDGTTAATVTLASDKLAGDYVNVAYASASFATADIGTGKAVTVNGISIIGGADAGNYALGNTTAATTANITIASATTTLTVTPSSQQYSDTVTFKATISPDQLGGVAPATSVTFKIGTQVMGTANLATGTGSDSGKLVSTLADVQLLGLNPGSKTVTAAFNNKNPNFTINDPTTALTVTTENADATYSGNSLFWGASSSASSATATLAATVIDAPDGARGDIRNATVTFVNRDASNATLCTAPVGLVSADDTTVGTATCNVTLPINTSQSATMYTVGIVVSGYYAENTANDNTVITVAQPLTSSFITGGGYLLNQASAGLYAGDAGQKTNFGLNVKFNRNGTNLQGQINTIVRHGGRVYQVKGNSMTSLVTHPCTTGDPSPTCPATATFNGKASLQDITNPLQVISLDGNATLQVTLTDKGEPGTGDSIGITVWNKAGGMWFSSRWSGTTTIEQLLGGGNLSAH
jgi:hypothetical protein